MSLATRSLWTDLLAIVKSQLEGGEFSLNVAFAIFRRRWIVLAVCVAACMAGAVLLSLVTPPLYTSQSLLQITARQDNLAGAKDVVGSVYATEAAIRSEVDVLTSARLAERVVTRLKLQNNPAFQKRHRWLEQVGGALQALLLPMPDVDKDSAEAARKALEMATAVEKFQHNLRVQMRPRSYTIQVNFVANDPQLSADINNTLIQEYLTNQLEERFDATRRASTWINERMLDLQRKVQATDLAVEKFREAHGLTRARGVLLSEQQMSELNSQLILARTQLAETQAKMSTAGTTAGSTSEVLNNPLIQNLRIQETEVRRKMSDLAARYGDRHPRMQTVRNELQDVQRKIAEESAKIRSSLSNDVTMAQARVDTLEKQLAQLQTDASLGNDASVKLAELERQAQAERTLYQTFLNRSKEIAQLDFAQADARLIASATPPLKASNPKTLKYLLGGLVLGLASGLLLAIGLEGLDMSFRSTQQLESYLKLRTFGLTGELAKPEADHVAQHPNSTYSESLRTIRTGLQFANPDTAIRTLMVTSSVPREGKSFFALGLAQLAAGSGSKVLLVDADLRRPMLGEYAGFKPKAGLAEVLVQSAKAQDVIFRQSKTLDIMPAMPNGQFSQELLGSKRMQDLLAEWRKKYDLVILDCPPVMAVSDSMTLAQHADAVLFMVRWGATPRPLVRYTLEKMRAVHAPMAGTVLTRVDLDRHSGYGFGDYGYYHDKYKDYYTSEA